jgi:hypothetical protein
VRKASYTTSYAEAYCGIPDVLRRIFALTLFVPLCLPCGFLPTSPGSFQPPPSQVKIKLLSSRPGDDAQFQLLTSFVINDSVAADAGSLGFSLNAHERKSVQHIVLTHAHLDHIASLPIFIDEEFSRLTSPVIVHAIPEVISVLRQFIFNDHIWPNFEKITLRNQSRLARNFIPSNRENASGWPGCVLRAFR